MTTVAAALTVHDAEEFLPELVASIKDHVDEIVVGIDVDHTTDRTREVAESLGCRVVDVSIMRDGERDFAQARNQTLEKAALTTDYFVWIDRDDILVANVPLKQIIAEAEAARPGVESIWLPYLYSRDAYGNIVIRQYRERIIRLSAKPQWMARLHETCHTENGPRAIWAEGALDYDKARVWVDHKNRKLTEAGKWERNFPILMKMVEEDPGDLRAVREVAEAYFAATQWDKSVEWYERYLDATQGDQGTPQEERWMAVVYKAKAERMAGRVGDSMRTADRGILMCPQYADSYFELAYGYAVQDKWLRAIYWFEEAQKHGRPDGILHTSPADYEGTPYRFLHASYAQAGDLVKARECVQKALAFFPEDEDLNKALIGYAHLHNRRSVIEASLQNARFLMATNEPLKAKAVLEALPAGASEDYADVEPLKAKAAAALETITSLQHMRRAAMQEPLADDAGPTPAADWLRRVLKGRVLWMGLEHPSDALGQDVQIVGADIDPRKVARANFAAVEKGLLELVDAPEHTGPETPYDPIEHPHPTWTADCSLCGPVARLPRVSTQKDLRPDLKVQFHVGDIERPYQFLKDLGPFDAVVLNGVLERAIDLDKAIESAESLAPLVVVLTPDGTAPTPERQGVVRAWSQKELEGIFWKRGQIIESNYGFAYRPKVDISEHAPIVIYCGPGLERWSPDQIDREGLGGSETAVVHLAKELTARDKLVMVYAEAEGVWDGVLYRHHTKFVPGNPVVLFIAWRNPTLVDFDLNAQRRYLWLHDVDSGDLLTEERAAKFDGLLILSEWHRAHLKEKYPFIPDEKYTIIGNGIDPSRFEGSEERDVNRFVYVSSPDRGLERALVQWPFIRKEYPEAKLDIFYGWENYDRLMRDPAFKYWIKDKAQQDGIEWHGRIGQKQLARELMKSGGLFYPGPHSFEETFCISALEAQAAGCIPVTRDNGALPETNKYGPVLSTRYATVIDYALALKDTSQSGEDARAVMATWAKTQTWGAVAERFLDFVRASYVLEEVAA